MLTVGYNTIYLMIQTYLCLFWTHHLYVLMNNFTLAIFCRILEGTVLSIDPFNQKSITISFIQTNLNYSWQIPSIQKTLLFLLIEILVPPKKYNQKKKFAKKITRGCSERHRLKAFSRLMLAQGGHTKGIYCV